MNKYQYRLIRSASKENVDGVRWRKRMERWMNALASAPFVAGVVNQYLGFEFISDYLKNAGVPKNSLGRKLKT